MRRFLPGLLIALAVSAFAADKIEKHQFDSNSGRRTYYLYVPPMVNASAPVPLLLVLHGSGHNGLSLVEPWKDLAKRENFIVAGPDSTDPQQWSAPGDGPGPLYDLVEALKSKYPINPRRVYMFGHSAGASFGLQMALLESNYFAAAAVHAGYVPGKADVLIAGAERKIPLQIQVGSQDQVIPVEASRQTRDDLVAAGFAPQFLEIPGHDHNYYVVSKSVNRTAWDFLKNIELRADPVYRIVLFR